MTKSDAETVPETVKPNSVDVGAAPCPPDRWHPIYDSVKRWLDAEAPEPDPKPKAAARNAKRRPGRRGNGGQR